jgi:hypothetical protein
VAVDQGKTFFEQSPPLITGKFAALPANFPARGEDLLLALLLRFYGRLLHSEKRLHRKPALAKSALPFTNAAERRIYLRHSGVSAERR